MEKTTEKKGIRSKFLRIFWQLFAFGILCVVLIFVFINIGWIGYLPPIDELQNPKSKYATEIYSSDLQLIGSYFRKIPKYHFTF